MAARECDLSAVYAIILRSFNEQRVQFPRYRMQQDEDPTFTRRRRSAQHCFDVRPLVAAEFPEGIVPRQTGPERVLQSDDRCGCGIRQWSVRVVTNSIASFL